MNDIRYQVFVSSTYRDLIQHRQKVINSLMSVNAIPVGMEIFPSSDEDAWSIITSYIDLSDYYVVIIGGCYGSVNPETGISYTEMEYDYAVSKSIPVMPFLHENVGELRRNMTEEDPVKALKLKAFQEKAKLRHCNFYSDEKDLALKVITSYSQMTARRPGIGWIRGDQAKTKEEAERMAYLERRVGELEKQLSSSQEYIELYEECEIPYELQILVRYNGKPEPTNPKKISMPFNEILAAIKDEMLTGISESAISKNVSEFANNKYLKITLTEKDHVYLQNDTLELIIKFLSLRGLIEFEKSYSQHAGTRYTYYMTDICKEYLLNLERGKITSTKA